MSSQPDHEVLINVLASAAAGVIARIFTHPLDTAKARIQALPSSPVSSSYRGPLHVLQSTVQGEGFAGLYRGFGAVIIGGTPGTVLYLTSYDLAKKNLGFTFLSSSVSNNNTDLVTSTSSTSKSSVATEFAVHFTSGMIAEAIACIIYVPVDVVKERLQVQSATDNISYKGSLDAIVTIARNEGIPALYKGYGATLLSFGSYSGLFFLLYEQMLLQVKHHLSNDANDSKNVLHNSTTVPFHWTLACSASAGAVASWLTSPLDMAKLRLQVQRGKMYGLGEDGVATAAVSAAGGERGAIVYRNVWDCLVQSFRQSGFSGLFRGAGARVLHFAPAATLTITSYETCRSLLTQTME